MWQGRCRGGNGSEWWLSSVNALCSANWILQVENVRFSFELIISPALKPPDAVSVNVPDSHGSRLHQLLVVPFILDAVNHVEYRGYPKKQVCDVSLLALLCCSECDIMEQSGQSHQSCHPASGSNRVIITRCASLSSRVLLLWRKNEQVPGDLC